MADGERMVNFESMFQSVTDTVRDMSDLKKSIEKEIKDLRNDIYPIMQKCDLRITALEKKVDVWERIRFVGVGGAFGVLLTMVILFLTGLV
ncbi:MAG: hypothetical protein KAJ19_25695 [Gammaproteobacteria bacterium]|nr:hypothetical protein [Gammaproteobacteria bacterium]